MRAGSCTSAETADSGIWERFPCLGIFLLPTLPQPHRLGWGLTMACLQIGDCDMPQQEVCASWEDPPHPHTFPHLT